MITLQKWLGKEVLTGQRAIRIVEPQIDLVFETWITDWQTVLQLVQMGTSLYHGSQERDCDSRAVQMYTLDIRSHIFAIQDQWRGNESRWHYLRDRFTAALNYRAKLIYKCPYSFSWNTKKCLGIFGKLYHYMRPIKGHHKDGHPLIVFPVWGRWEEGSRVNDPSASLASSYSCLNHVTILPWKGNCISKKDCI